MLKNEGRGREDKNSLSYDGLDGRPPGRVTARRRAVQRHKVKFISVGREQSEVRPVTVQ